MTVSRRRLLQYAAALPALPLFGRAAAQTDGPPPVIFVHGNGDHAALWMTTLWRFEANGWPRDRLVAFNFTDPLSRNDDAVPMAGRSGTEDQLRELAAVVRSTLARTGAGKVALVGSSRGGYAIRNFVTGDGAGQVSHAVLCGTPNRGVFDWEFNPGSEFNGRGPFLRRLNGRDTDIVPGTAFLTLYSEGNDKFAQADGRYVGRPGTPTGITTEGPTLRGATNIGLGPLDHREVAFHPRAFREIYRFIVGAEPATLAVAPESIVALDGLVTGNAGGIPSNRPLGDAVIEVFRVHPDTAGRQGEALLRRTTGPDGRWGPVSVSATDWLEFVVEAPGHPRTHIFRSPFPRSSEVVHLRPARPLSDADRAAGAVVLMTRPRGYFGIPRDVVLLGGKEAGDVTRGVATDATTTLRLPAAEIGRAVVGLFNEERVVARAVPTAENRIAVAELTW
ncbi:MAG: hydrolase [Phreatobacter sp.]|uniref:hydrolase n=1 Tax=Phreatobacter sp. TaxID=1966341 RepID=UPI001A3F0331|nr:hydrolase [Phreatobacter sp.]MBL8570124.1 hydrolase [Phreatobacter sp.]